MNELEELKDLIRCKINLYKEKIEAIEWYGGHGLGVAIHSRPKEELEWVLSCLEKIETHNNE